MKFNNERKAAADFTRAENQRIAQNIDSRYTLEEDEDIAEFNRHVILKIEDSKVIQSNEAFVKQRKAETDHISDSAPDTVNPYLWKYSRDIINSGVVKISDGMYAVIGFESAPIIFIRSQNGWIVQDVGGSYEGATDALRLAEEAINEEIHGHIKAVIYSHNHVDHFGGIKAIGNDEDFGTAKDGKIPIHAPAGFNEHLIDENLYAGIPMNRRIQYQIGFLLPRDEQGWVSSGLHLGYKYSKTSRSTILPTELINEDITLNIDGVNISFILTPDTETRSQMCTYFHDHKALYLGDNGIGVIHNVYTMRGTPVRDSNFWGKVFYKLALRFGDEALAVIPGHGLAHFKNPNRPNSVKKYLLDTAAAYKYTHDQALLYANEGYSSNELGNSFKVPESILRTWYTQGIYGQYAFNAKAVYQKYLGFYDGNPVNLAPLPEYELAGKLIEYMGDTGEILKKAYEDFRKGQYQWVASITNHIVHREPDNLDARYLCADALEQLAYLEENSLRRNAYLSGALELRHPDFNKKITIKPMDNSEVIPYVSADLILDHLGINYDGYNDSDRDLSFILRVIDGDSEEYHSVHIYRGTILHERTEYANNQDIITILKSELYDLSVKKYTGSDEILKSIQKYVVDTSEYANFNLIEPIAQLRK